MELNKHILLVMKWLDDKDSVSKDELIENRKSAADTYAVYAADTYADAATAEYWVDKYLERSGENKQDYIDAIEAGKKPQEPESKEWDGEGLPPIGCECLFKYDQGGDPLKLLIMGYFEDLVWATEDHRTTPYSGSHRTIIKTQGKFSPLKTEKEKEREYSLCYLKSLQPTVHGSCADKIQDYLDVYATMLIDAGVKAPEGE